MTPKIIDLNQDEYDDLEYLSIDNAVNKYDTDINEYWSRMTNYIYQVNEVDLMREENYIKILDKNINVQLIYDPFEDTYYLNPLDEAYSHKIALAYMVLYAPENKEYGIIDWDFLDNISIVKQKDSVLNPFHYKLVYKQLRKQIQERRSKDLVKFCTIHNFISEC